MPPDSILKHFGFTALVSIIVARFGRFHNLPYRSRDEYDRRRSRKAVGDYGEQAAASWLRQQGYKILEQNFKGPKGGEVDIIARKGKLLHFIEVKTRYFTTKIRPFDAVTREKQALIQRGADHWLKRLGTRELPWRFDVIEVLVKDGEKPSINHIKDGF